MNFAEHIAKAVGRLRELEQELASFDFKAKGGSRFQQLHREHQRLTRIHQLWQERLRLEEQLAANRDLLAAETDPAFLDVVRSDVRALTERFAAGERELKTVILPPRENEDSDAILEIRPATGGDEAGLFAYDLFRMYSHYAEQKGWKQELLELSESDVGGLKEAIVSLRGTGVFRALAYESGVHRVQRVPTTEASGRIHTSTVTVAVLPEAEEVDFEINPGDLRMDVFRSSGHGGQSVNRTDSAVRMTYIPTGLSVASQQEKSQHKNRDIAMRLLRSRLLKQKQDAEAARYAAERRQQVGSGERNERIRTYNFLQNRVTDHRFDLSVFDLPGVLAGERFAELVDQILVKDLEQRLAEELK